MQYKHNKKIIPTAKTLRKNMTKEEKHFWYDFLRDFPVKFIRQKVIGNYIVDFYSSTARLVIELDGAGHYEDDAIIYDQKRTEFLESYGLTVVRIQNYEINTNFEGVCSYIEEIVYNIINKNEDLS